MRLVSRIDGRIANAAVVAFIAALFLNTSHAFAQTVGVVADPIDPSGGSGYVTVFDPQTKAVLGSVDIPSTLGPWDSCISPDETLAYVPNLDGEIYIVDLTLSPPALAGGTNPITITSPGESCCITCDGNYLLACANSVGPVSVVDLNTRTEVDFLDLGLGGGCHEIVCCDDGVNVLAAGGGNVRRLIIDSAGQLTDTGETLVIGGFALNVCCAPGSHHAVAVNSTSNVVTSFAVQGMTAVDTATLPDGTDGICCVICCEGDRLYVRSDDGSLGQIRGFNYDWLTGQIGSELFTLAGFQGTTKYFGVNQLAVNQDCTELYNPVGSPVSQVNVHDADTGAFLTSFTTDEIVYPAGISLVGWWPTGDCMVTDGTDNDVTIFNSQFMSRVATVTVPNGGDDLSGCCITPDGTTGFVVDGTDQVWVIDLTTNPPQLAAGTNPVLMTNQHGLNCCVTCDGDYLLVCDGNNTEPISVIDIAARAEAGFHLLQEGIGCREIVCCDDGVSVLSVGTDNVIRRLTIDAAGDLTDTGETLDLGIPILNVCCASGSLAGVAVSTNGTVNSFTIPGLTLVDTRDLTGGVGVSCSICWDGSAVYVRSIDEIVAPTTSWVDCFHLDRYSGQLGTGIPLIAGLEEVLSFVGVDQILVNRDCTRIFVPENSPTLATSVYDAATGELIASIIDPNNEEPFGICCPPCCNPWVLYAADGSGGNPSDLLILDPDTGDVIRNVGPIGYAVTGLAVDPFDGTLYGSTARSTGTRALLTIDKSTGAGTLVGNFNLDGQTMSDLDFCPDGTLLGWVESNDDDLARIDKGTGQAQLIGDAGVGTAISGLAVDHTGNVFFGGRNNVNGDGLLFIDPYFSQVIGDVPYSPSNEYGMGMSFGPDNVLYAIEKLGESGGPRNLVTINTTSGDVTTIGPTVENLDALAWDCPLPFPPVFKKVLIDGPDRNGDFQIDPIIEAHSHSSSTYVFRIEVNQPDLPPMMVMDEIPANWKLIECVPDNPDDIVQDFGGPRDPDVHDHRSRIIQWFPTDNTGGLTCTVRTRRHGKRHYEPHDCGRCFINLGAEALDTGGLPLFDEHGLPLISNPICIGAVKDKNHDHVIDWSGQGDEDGDTLTDWFECCVLGTDPCKRDTDRDHVDDNVNADPLDPNVQ